MGADEKEPEQIDIKAAAKAFSRLGASKGGKARAEKLTPEKRSEIAQKASEARWSKGGSVVERGKHPKATHVGVLPIGGVELPCAVLEDGTRVFTQQGFLQAIGRSKSPSGSKGHQGDQLPPFLSAKNLKRFISKELEEATKPVFFKPLQQTNPGSSNLVSGHRGIAYGYKVELLPLVCHVYLEARTAGVLKSGSRQNQARIAAQCELLTRGLATVGIIALVDEATGYQRDREDEDLRKILAAYIRQGELRKWTERFPIDYYREMFRLRGWKFDETSSKRPRIIQAFTSDFVYKKLPPGVYDELKRKNPPVYRGGSRKHKHHRFLTDDIGDPHLVKQLVIVTTLMRVSETWSEFQRLFAREFPSSSGHQGELNFPDRDPDPDPDPEPGSN